jgi:hypothetical protein
MEHPQPTTTANEDPALYHAFQAYGEDNVPSITNITSIIKAEGVSFVQTKDLCGYPMTIYRFFVKFEKPTTKQDLIDRMHDAMFHVNPEDVYSTNKFCDTPLEIAEILAVPGYYHSTLSDHYVLGIRAYCGFYRVNRGNDEHLASLMRANRKKEEMILEYNELLRANSALKKRAQPTW